MKKILFLLSLSIFIGCTSKSVEYFDTNYKIVFQEAKAQNKLIFIDFYTIWCGGCTHFEKAMMHDTLFKEYMQSKFLTAKINAEILQNKKLVNQLNIKAYPTFLILDTQGNEISRKVGFGFKNAEEFVQFIENTLKGKEDLEYLKKSYAQYPDSLELFQKIIEDKLLDMNLYKEALEFSKFVQSNSSSPEIIEEAKFRHAYALSKLPQNHSAKELARIAYQNDTSSTFFTWSLGSLYNYYAIHYNADSVNYYLKAILNNTKSPQNFYFLRKYADFLYIENQQIELADSLTKVYAEYGSNYMDHWTPYLKAHSLAKKGDTLGGLNLFDKWMNIYSKPENIKDDYWHYFFYTEYVTYYKIASEYATKHAIVLEKLKPNAFHKIRLAKIYFYNGEKQKAISKLKEAKELYEDPEKKAKVDDLIDIYQTTK